MYSLGLLANLVVLFVNLWGLALFTGWFCRNRWIAVAAGPWLFVTAVYAVENHHGLGRLQGAGVLLTFATLSLIWLSAGSWTPSRMSEGLRTRLGLWRTEFKPSRLLACGAVLIGMFLYAFAWRLASPDVDGSSEKLADLAYICSYLPGATIPVTDAWLHPYQSVQYYSFQHYAAGLMGRMLGLSPGATYNIAVSILVALAGFSFAGAVMLLTQKVWVRVLLISAFMVGGTGASGIVHLVYRAPALWNTVRFIGSIPYDQEPLGPIAKKYAEGYKHLELPGESFAYTAFLGDYHPPLSGYYLLGLGAMAAVLWQRTGQRRYAGLVGATLTWSILANTWSFPLQAIWILAWGGVNWKRGREICPAVIGGALVIWLAGWVYLSAFTAASVQYKTSLRLVRLDEHTPVVLFILFLLPTIGLTVLSFYTRKTWGLVAGVSGMIYLFLSEFFYMDDVYSGEFERFNTVLKWWPWIAAAMLLAAAPIILEQAQRRWVKVLGIFFCAYPCVFAFDLAKAWIRMEKPGLEHIEGTRFLTKNDPAKFMLARLKVETPGVVAERPNKDSYTNSACLPLFAGHRLWLGWVGHELLWHGYAADVGQRQERLMQFFRGEMVDSANWLKAQGIDYVLWYQDADTNETWTKLAEDLKGSFVWQEVFTGPDGRKSGLWRRADGVKPSP